MLLLHKDFTVKSCVLMAVFVLVCLFCKLKWALKFETLHGECIFVWQTHKHVHTLHHTLALIRRTPGWPPLLWCSIPSTPKGPMKLKCHHKRKREKCWLRDWGQQKQVSPIYVPTTQSSENNNKTFWFTFQDAHNQTERSDGCRTELAMHYRNETNCKHSI